MAAVSYSFLSKKDSVEKLELLETEVKEDDDDAEQQSAVTFRIVRGSMTANNKFYWSFGEKPPFNFNRCYPVHGRIVSGGPPGKVADDYMHPVVWGIAGGTSSKLQRLQEPSHATPEGSLWASGQRHDVGETLRHSVACRWLFRDRTRVAIVLLA